MSDDSHDVTDDLRERLDEGEGGIIESEDEDDAVLTLDQGRGIPIKEDEDG